MLDHWARMAAESEGRAAAWAWRAVESGLAGFKHEARYETSLAVGHAQAAGRYEERSHALKTSRQW